MTQTTQPQQGRAWTWTPTPTMNRFMSTLLRLPLLHRILSGSMLLITFTGRHSGKTYTTPVGYQQDGQTVRILTKSFRKWWNNFIDPAPVTLRLRGRDVQGIARAITDENAVVPLLKTFIGDDPRQADIYQIDPNALADAPNSAEQMASKVVFIEVTLT